MTQDNALAPKEDFTVQLNREDTLNLIKQNIKLQEQNSYLHDKLCALESLLAQMHDEDYEAVDAAGEPIPPRKPRGFFMKLLDLPMQVFRYFRGW
jgi:hypothetical protein